MVLTKHLIENHIKNHFYIILKRSSLLNRSSQILKQRINGNNENVEGKEGFFAIQRCAIMLVMRIVRGCYKIRSMMLSAYINRLISRLK
ncbi:hypothetical protein BpHYR1_019916 [Brachionus plicatilis]|uniref:Uncharacterized protein n=1 Tax=Brachionus plicatilis TaxID=10195 RepID=A0A3M7PT01_BRAPC|nr:hypothetical protein BpHYR1_019916 [Brachionus plicatilis]